MITPIFSTALGSVGKSLLTTNFNGDLDETSPIGIFDIAKKHKLNSVYVLDNSMSSFIQVYENAEKSNIDFRFGIKMLLSHDKEDPKKHLGKYNVFIKNTKGYEELINLTSFGAIKNAKDKTNEITQFDDVKDLMESDNLIVMIPFYDSFLFNNYFYCGKSFPSLSKIKPFFCIENHETIYDYTFKDIVLSYCKSEGMKSIDTHQIYYYKNKHIKPYLLLRAINKRGNWQRPELSHFSSDKFSFEHYDLLRSKKTK